MRREPLYSVGDIVRVKDLITLKDELGDPINALCGWYEEGMDQYAGGVYEVSDVHYADHGRKTPYYIYRFKDTESWWFSEDVLEHPFDSLTREDSIHQSMSYEEVMGIL